MAARVPGQLASGCSNWFFRVTADHARAQRGISTGIRPPDSIQNLISLSSCVVTPTPSCAGANLSNNLLPEVPTGRIVTHGFIAAVGDLVMNGQSVVAVAVNGSAIAGENHLSARWS